MVSLVVVLLVLDPVVGAAPAKPETAPIDTGSFTVQIGRNTAGHEEFSIREMPGGFEIRSSSTAVGGNTSFVTMQGTLHTTRDWRPVDGHFEASVGGRPSIVDLKTVGGNLRLVTRIGSDRPITVKGRRPIDLVVVQNALAHLIPLCALAGDKPRVLTAFPDAEVVVFAPMNQTFYVSSELHGTDRPKLKMAVVSVNFGPDIRTELVCKGHELVAVRQGRFDVTAFRPGYESVADVLPIF